MITYWGSKVSKGDLPLTEVTRLCSDLFPDLVSSSSFCQHANISDMQHSIWTKIGHKDKNIDRNFQHDQIGVKGHDRVTEVKNVNHA